MDRTLARLAPERLLALGVDRATRGARRLARAGARPVRPHHRCDGAARRPTAPDRRRSYPRRARRASALVGPGRLRPLAGQQMGQRAPRIAGELAERLIVAISLRSTIGRTPTHPTEHPQKAHNPKVAGSNPAPA